MTPDQIDAIARAGFEASHPIQTWTQIGADERERWRLATPYTTPQTIRDGRFTNYFGMLDWEDLTPRTRAMWGRITAAMLARRLRLGLPTTVPTPAHHPLIRTA